MVDPARGGRWSDIMAAPIRDEKPMGQPWTPQPLVFREPTTDEIAQLKARFAEAIAAQEPLKVLPPDPVIEPRSVGFDVPAPAGLWRRILDRIRR